MAFKVKRKKVRSLAFDRCVEKVRKKDRKVRNPFAICTKSLGKKAFVKEKKKKEDRKTFKMKSNGDRESFVRGREFRSLIGLAIGLGVLSAVLRSIQTTKK